MYTASQLVSMGYGGYAGWGDPAAGYDFQATGGSGKKTASNSSGGGSSAQDLVNAEMAAADARIKQETSYLDTQAKNPFTFDEAMAKQASSAEYSPYYTQLLTDYLGKIGVNQDSLQSEDKLLKDLTTTPSGTAGVATRAYTQAVDTAKNGYASTGGYFSGGNQRVLGQGEVARTQDLQTNATAILNTNRDIFGNPNIDPTTGKPISTGEFGAAVEQGVNNRQSEAEKAYYNNFVQGYMKQFPTGDINVLKGYLPADYLSL